MENEKNSILIIDGVWFDKTNNDYLYFYRNGSEYNLCYNYKYNKNTSESHFCKIEDPICRNHFFDNNSYEEFDTIEININSIESNPDYVLYNINNAYEHRFNNKSNIKNCEENDSIFIDNEQFFRLKI